MPKSCFSRQDLCGGGRGQARLRGEGGEERPGDLGQPRDQARGLRLPQQLERRVDLRRGPGEWLHTDPVNQEVDVTQCHLVLIWNSSSGMLHCYTCTHVYTPVSGLNQTR